LLVLALGACQQSARNPVTLTYFRVGWSQLDAAEERLAQQFTQETGVQLTNLPVPENTLDTLDLSRKLLQEGGLGPDVLFIDLVWSGILGRDLIDLRPGLTTEISSLEPQVLPSYTVDGKMIAIPYRIQVGVLEYRADLLHEYGYDHPPKTWDELEGMAERIQAGERAKGNKDFWGYVWQGAAAESLTCNALEWQAAEGGGRIIENDRAISVNNPAAIRAWQRAKRWIGWISPPGVVAYRELDSSNVFDSGGAAFNRVWRAASIKPGGHPPKAEWRSSLKTGKAGYTGIPGGPKGQAGSLGGLGLAVSRVSPRPQEAVELVRFLIRAQIKSNEQEGAAADQFEVYDLPSVLDPDNRSQKSHLNKGGLVSRPSIVSGRAYEEVTKAYISAVHTVLTGKSEAPEAAAELEKQLIKITGFSTGPPGTAD
jgi:trehalose/maltose transport system substrate-binding protein